VNSSSCSAPLPATRGRLLLLTLLCVAALALLKGGAVTARAQAAPQADLTVTKTGDETAQVGGQITYSLAVSNAGPDTATNVVLTDTIPAHTTFVSADSPTGTVNFDGTTLTVTFSSIPAFETGTAALVVSVDNDTPRNTTISNTASATASTTDPNTSDNSSTALTVVTGPFAGDLLISEFRLRGPGGANDEFVEIYNNGETPHLVNAADGSEGYGVVASDGVLRCTVPNGTVIPARGHFLCANSGPVVTDSPARSGAGGPARGVRAVVKAAAYSLDLYPAGEDTTATADATYSTDIPDNAGIALFRTTDSDSFTLDNRLDAVGSTAETNVLYKEGTGYPALSGVDYTNGIEYAFYRDACGKGGSNGIFGPCPVNGLPRDTDNNATDFVFVDTNGTPAGAGQRLGAPGPENLSSPVQSNDSFNVALLDPCVGTAAAPNRVRDFTSDPANNSTFGTLDIRRTVTNQTGLNVTRLRWRIIDITTFPNPPGVADLRARTSGPVVVTVDRAPCGSGTSNVNVQGTELEEPPAQPNGGGYNSSLSSGTITLETPLAAGDSIDVRFLLGIQQTGNFKFFVNIEALTREPEIIIEETPAGRSLTGQGLRAQPVRASRRD
jgi:uncharacterized repeat protein (TIGR01451 family)